MVTLQQIILILILFFNFLYLEQLGSHNNLLAIFRELDCIRQKVEQNLHISQSIAHDLLEKLLPVGHCGVDSVVATLLIGDIHRKLLDEFDFLLGSLVLHGVEGLLYQLVVVEVLFIELEVHCFQLCQVKQIIYQCDQHA